MFAALASLKGAKGRLDLVGDRNGAPVFVDYAHKPDALEKAIEALRPYVKRQLVVVFGAGGDRDKGKRPLMGAIAAKSADRVIVTDDNPRSENPPSIRATILDGASRAPNVREIGDRREAIRGAVAALEPGDVLLIAGKGHETGQIVGDTTLAVQRSRGGRSGAAGEGGMSAVRCGRSRRWRRRWARSRRARCRKACRGFRSTPAPLQPGEAFFALKDVRDGHDFVEAALKAGGGLGRRRRRQARHVSRTMRRCWWCPTCWRG